ncbi:GNAT family acetyltransferase [Pontibacillus chungwhensis BH030062]|uniref:GNAT family acetyltransferase n=1 Tax=Pontibacillus chungwhensis BH030062 TaxID=1385513 RepID=A0A0A2VAF3_9BACI|nr:GNAT family N-acetyltransferase [Pontibacillus chungwhensis]KGP90680.1 GNAT family acetyltransferase [Pontibacillus chungwhensis BH030062]
MNIRRAVDRDAEGIAKVHVDSWRTTYKNIIPDKVLQKLSYDQRTGLWKKNISKDGNFVFVAENENGEIVGFADCGKRENSSTENAGDLTSIYLLEEYQGKGIGKELMKRLFQQFRELNYTKVFVEVLDDNKTRYFYEHYGAELLKKETIKMGGAELSLLIYQWESIEGVSI